MESFCTAAKKAWLYLRRVKEGVKFTEIRNYQEKQFPRRTNIHSGKLQCIGDSSFKVRADCTLLEQLDKPENWSKGVLLKKCKVFRKSKFKDSICKYKCTEYF